MIVANQHGLESTFRELHYLFKGLVQLDLCQLVRVLYQAERFFGPLFVKQVLRSNLIEPLLWHPRYICLTVLLSKLLSFKLVIEFL
jgi:hypothetical protein